MYTRVQKKTDKFWFSIAIINYSLMQGQSTKVLNFYVGTTHKREKVNNLFKFVSGISSKNNKRFPMPLMRNKRTAKPLLNIIVLNCTHTDQLII